MNKPQKLVVGFIVICLVIIALLTIILMNKSLANPNNTLYYGITCPHCKLVEDFIAKNNITLKFEQKEVYLNKTNAAELIAVGNKCKVQKEYIGAVPLLYYNQTCYLGDVDIINFLNKTKVNN